MKPALKLVAANDSTAGAVSSRRRIDVGRYGRTAGALALEGVRGTVKAMRYAVFYVLMWLRMLVHLVTSFAAGIGLIALAIGAVVHPDWSVLGKIAAFSFGAFVVGWLYDGLVLLVSPEPIFLDGRAAEGDK